ncbi:MAG: hypothetical protein HC915_15380 [Anaerolineae bacterium]|nr:hypothetical protein [Anaerolineae bacterium]
MRMLIIVLLGLLLWDALPAVRAGNAHVVGYYWWGDSLLSAHAMLDDLFRYVAKVDPAEAAPNPAWLGQPEARP